MAHLFAKWIILLTLKMHEHETEQPKCAKFLQSFMPTADYSWSLQSFFSCLSLFLVTLHNDDLSFESLFTPCYMFWAISCIYTYMYRCSGLWPWFFGAFFPKQFFFSRCYIIVSAVRYLLAVVAIYWSCLWIIRTFTITPVILP